MDSILEVLGNLAQTTGIVQLLAWDSSVGLFDNLAAVFGPIIMIAVACVLLYLGIKKQFEPLLLVGIAFGMLLSNLPGSGLYHPELWDGYIAGSVTITDIFHDGGLLDILYIGVKSGLYPSLIFLGVGAMTDFAPLLANPKSLLLGAAAQFGIF